MGAKINSGKKYLFISLLLLFIFIICSIFFYIRCNKSIPVLRLSETEEAFSEHSAPTTEAKIQQNPYADLSVPTSITKIYDTYFIVDCYHNQIIYSDSLKRPLYEWNIMTDQINKGHTLASDGTVYLTDDTENNRILIFEKNDTGFVHTQTFSDIGIRPHYIVYHEKENCFYAWSSMTGEMYVFRREDSSNRVFLSEILRVPSLDGIYVRSFTILENDIYFVSGNSSIIKADLNSFKIKEEYPVPDEIAGMIQISFIDGYYYITVSTDKAGNQDAATIIRTKDLKSLQSADYEDVYSHFIGGGTPYYISFFDNHYYLTEHRLPGHSIWSFQSQNGELTNIAGIY